MTSLDNNSTGPVLSCGKLSKTYKQGPQIVRVLDNINFDVQKSERVAIIGASGAGKSTLLNLLGGLDDPSEGEVLIKGRAFSCLSGNERGRLRNRELGFVYQFHHLLGEFTALENVCMPLLIGRSPVEQARREATDMLARVGLENRLEHKPAELSGGERQRVAIARALVTKPACVLMDEPTGNLDSHTAKNIQTLMEQLNRDLQTSFVVVTHDEHFAQGMDRIMHLENGTLREADQSQGNSGLNAEQMPEGESGV